MLPPTLLPSGDQLRDMCIEHLLMDDTSRRVVRRLLRTPGYRGLLPEAVLQMIGSTVGKRLDMYMSQVLRFSAPNLIHRALAESKYRVFTTNFDLCLEKAGTRQAWHLHGSIKRPEGLQNQLYRLGKTAHTEATRLGILIRQRALLVIGYSFRDDDIVNMIVRHPPTQLLYLSFDGTIPQALRELPCDVVVSKGSVQKLLRVTPPDLVRTSPLRLFPTTRLPAVRHRANALIRICSRAGLYDEQLKVLHAYLPKLHGRQRLLAMCEVADSLRLARRYAVAEHLAQKILRDRFAQVASCRDVMSTALVQCGLVALDRGDTDFDKIESLFRQGLQVFEELVTTETPGKYEAENDIWRARIFNNLGLVLAARAKYGTSMEMYQRSLRLKARHHDRYGIAQTYANLAKVQILAGDVNAAVTSMGLLVDQLARIPDAYICADAIAGCLTALRDSKRLTVNIRNPSAASARSEQWWQKLLLQSHSSSRPIRRILANLRQLSSISKRFLNS